MIKSNQKHFNRLHIVMDAIIIVAAYMSAWAIKFASSSNDAVGRIGLKTYLMALIFVVPAYLILYAIFNLYTPKRMHGQRYEMFNVIKANTIGLLMFILWNANLCLPFSCISLVLCVPLEFATLLWVYPSDITATAQILCHISCVLRSEIFQNS